jgi:putative ATP-dependent endonuclease of OLD family
MHLEALEIHNFRGIKECKSALPNKRVLCLIGAGDSTKSTILDAVFLNLLPNWNINATDSDFYEGDTSKAITICYSALQQKAVTSALADMYGIDVIEEKL